MESTFKRGISVGGNLYRIEVGYVDIGQWLERSSKPWSQSQTKL